MKGRDARNLRLALLGEWAAEKAFGLEPGDLPSSCIRAVEQGEGVRDGGYDFITPNGYRIDVKASGPEFPDLMIPIAHEEKFRRPSCVVDAFVKVCVDAAAFACVCTLMCWEWRVTFLQLAHRSDTRFPIPTLWMTSIEAHPIGRVVDVPVTSMRAIDVHLGASPDERWQGWLTL